MKTLFLILLFFSTQLIYAVERESVPGKIRFADIELELDKDARALVEEKIKTLREDRTHLREFHERAALYFPLIEKVLRNENVPSDFKYLALQESMLLAHTTSRSDAVGFWQLKDFNAKELGIRVDSQVDERKHPMSSTMAAAKYLKKNHYFMQNWLYTLLSYRLGITGVTNKIDRKYIGATTMKLDGKMHTYIAHYLAYKIVFNRPVGQPKYRLYEFAQASEKSISSIAGLTQIDAELIKQYNPWLKVAVVPISIQNPLLLPLVKEQETTLIHKLGLIAPSPSSGVFTSPEELELAVNKVAVEKSNKPASSTLSSKSTRLQDVGSKYPILTERRVQKVAGEDVTLVTANGIPAFVAGRFKNSYNVLEGLKISDAKFRKYNEMTKFETLVPGQVYYLKKKNKKGPVKEHIARRGESIWEVSQRYGIRSSSIIKNNLMSEGEDLVAGRVLLLQDKRSKKSKPVFKDIPVDTPKTTTDKPAVANNNTNPNTNSSNKPNTTGKKVDASNAVVNNRFHIVKDGENVFSIARDYGITPIQIQKWNDLPADLALTTGQILIVKGDNAVASGKSSTNPEDAPFDPLANVVLLDDEGNPINAGNNNSANSNSNTKQPLPGGNDPQESNVKEISHLVKRGETLYKIARKYEVEEDQIVAWNKLNNRFVRPGQRLKIIQVEAKKLNLTDNTTITSNNNKPIEATNDKKEVTPQKPKTHTVTKGETLYAIARKYNLNVKDFMSWNKMSSNNATIVVGQVLNLEDPAVIIENTTDQTEPALRQSSTASNTVPEGYHLVLPGETVYDVAFKYNLTQTEIREWNNLKATDRINDGDRLIVNRVLARSIAKAKEKPSTAPKTKYHVVAKNETLYRIALKYGVKSTQIQEWNNLRGTSIAAGQKLIIGYTPGIREASIANNNMKVESANTQQVFHTVKKGETLYSIARRYKVKVGEIQKLSNKQSSTLKVGEKLRVK